MSGMGRLLEGWGGKSRVLLLAACMYARRGKRVLVVAANELNKQDIEDCVIRMSEWRTALVVFLGMLICLWVMFQVPADSKLVDLPWGCGDSDYVEPLYGPRGE